jgi:disulfide oxidoreductase YuzD
LANSHDDPKEQNSSRTDRVSKYEVNDFIVSLIADLRDSRKNFKTQYSSITPPLSDSDYESLRESIKENGLLVPLVVNQDGVLLDGYHRLRACRELNIRPKYHKREFKDKAQEKQLVIEVNLIRRQLNEFQKVELGFLLEDIETEKAKKRMYSGGHSVGVADRKNQDGMANNQEKWLASADATLQPGESKGKVSQIIAKKIGVSSATYERGKKIIEKAAEGEKLALRKGDVGITTVYNKIRKQETDQLINQAPEAVSRNKSDTNVTLILNDFRSIDTACIPDDSVDIIFTEPQDRKKFKANCELLGIISSRVLRNGGSLLISAAQDVLPVVLDYMKNSGLKYWWQIANQHGISEIHRERQVRVMWKPILWFVKGDRLRTSGLIHDSIESQPLSNGIHNWEQSADVAENLISDLTSESDVVFDPMMGTGATGIAAINSKRQFIGIEQDPQAFRIAEARIRVLCPEDKITIKKQ